jgi:hypothetical protein
VGISPNRGAAKVSISGMKIKSFVTESIVRNRIAHSYKTRYVNETLHIYYIGSSQDTLTKPHVTLSKERRCLP